MDRKNRQDALEEIPSPCIRELARSWSSKTSRSRTRKRACTVKIKCGGVVADVELITRVVSHKSTCRLASIRRRADSLSSTSA